MSASALSSATRRELRAVFDAVDKHRRGKLSTADLAFLIRSFDDRKSDWEVQDLISEIDVGGGHTSDGRVDFEEFVSLMCRAFKTDAAAGAGAAGGPAGSRGARAGAGAGAGKRHGKHYKSKRKGGDSKRSGAEDAKALTFQLPDEALAAAAGGKGGGKGGRNTNTATAAAAAAAAAALSGLHLDDEQLHRFELRQAYAYLDWDGDGQISAEDLRLAFASIGDHYSPLEIEEIIREVSTVAAVAVHPHMTGVVQGGAQATALPAPPPPPAPTAATTTTTAAATATAAVPSADEGFDIGGTPSAGAESLTAAADTITYAEFMTALAP